jgi:hypothetical protein
MEMPAQKRTAGQGTLRARVYLRDALERQRQQSVPQRDRAQPDPSPLPPTPFHHHCESSRRCAAITQEKSANVHGDLHLPLAVRQL